jgi:hypothetical protein
MKVSGGRQAAFGYVLYFAATGRSYGPSDRSDEEPHRRLFPLVYSLCAHIGLNIRYLSTTTTYWVEGLGWSDRPDGLLRAATV